MHLSGPKYLPVECLLRTHHISSGTQIQKIGKPNNLKSLGAGRPKGLNMILPKSARVTYIYPAIA
jgi:hypothetical protein